MSSIYTIVLADAHAIVRQGLERIIKNLNDVKLLGEVSDGFELIKLIKQTKPNLAIIDIFLENLRGIEATHELKMINPAMKVIILTMSKSKEHIHQAISAGADGYLLKEDTSDELIEAIRVVRGGGTYISTLLSKEMVELYSKKFREKDKNATYEPRSNLTYRQAQILKLIAEGKSSAEIAKLLLIKSRTVQRHRYNMQRKLGFRENVDFLKYAIEHGYTENPEKTSQFIDMGKGIVTELDENERIIRSFFINYGDTPKIKPFILRSIEFSPEHHEAGLTILSYFGKIVREKYSGMKVKVNIEQEDLTVRMIIQSDEGNIEKIEKTLEDYGLVIKGEMPITEFISDPYQVIELKQQLRIAHMQIENQKEILSISNKLYGERIFNLEQQVNNLNAHIAMGLRLLDNKNHVLKSAIDLIYNKLNNDINQQDFIEIKEALGNIRERDQTLFSQIVEKITDLCIHGAISGVAGKLLYDFVMSLSKATM